MIGEEYSGPDKLSSFLDTLLTIQGCHFMSFGLYEPVLYNTLVSSYN